MVSNAERPPPLVSPKAFSMWAEFMVRVRVRIAVRGLQSFSVWTEFMVRVMG
jgi:hypothetical protein